jgi:UDP-N-acetylmuramoyl-L-alanyl-D-glutamate--2,6-diaminopimelate ligase
MKFEDVLAGITIIRRAGGIPDVAGVEYDSRRVAAGSLFVAMQGESTDGNLYIERAIAQGTAAVLTDSASAFDAIHEAATIAQVDHGRNALALASANFFAHPEKQLALTGITGTNGKTTTTFLLDAILNHAGRKTVLVGTIEYHVAGQVRPSPHTTPESRDLLALLREGVDAGATEAVMEVSSHALAQGRVHGLTYDVAVFTNLTRDHLDFHHTMDNYFSAKKRLFDGSLSYPPRVAVINIDDSKGAELAAVARAAGAQIFSYGLEAGEFRADDIRMAASGMSFALQTPAGSAEIGTRLSGKVNVYNLLAASAAAYARGLSLAEIQAGISALASVPGRFQTVNEGQPFTVVVDYAHTDDALRNLTAMAREFVSAGRGRVITLFGCGGDRDKTKRPLMGKAAGEGSDFVVLTSDNPRSEQPEAIMIDVLPGLHETSARYAVEPDRAAAIRLALGEAKAGDIVLIAGKGHEKTQTIGARSIPFDDVVAASESLKDLQRGTQR